MDTVALHAHSRFGFAHTRTAGWEPAWIKGCSPILRLPYMPYMFKHPNPSRWPACVGATHPHQGTSTSNVNHGQLEPR